MPNNFGDCQTRGYADRYQGGTGQVQMSKTPGYYDCPKRGSTAWTA